jgi:hypothetical protein
MRAMPFVSEIIVLVASNLHKSHKKRLRQGRRRSRYTACAASTQAQCANSRVIGVDGGLLLARDFGGSHELFANETGRAIGGGTNF